MFKWRKQLIAENTKLKEENESLKLQLKQLNAINLDEEKVSNLIAKTRVDAMDKGSSRQRFFSPDGSIISFQGEVTDIDPKGNYVADVSIIAKDADGNVITFVDNNLDAGVAYVAANSGNLFKLG